MSQRYLLRKWDRQEFYDEDGSWTTDCRKAVEFENSGLAVMKSVRMAEKPVVVLCFGNSPPRSLYLLCDSRERPLICMRCPYKERRFESGVRRGW